jgi:hypothetical protein
MTFNECVDLWWSTPWTWPNSWDFFLKKHIIPLDKNAVKWITQVNGHSLKLQFYMFERSQVKHNSLDCHKIFGIFFINCKVYMKHQSLTQIKNVFACSKHLNFESGQSLFFSNIFFSIKCAPFLLKLLFNID